VEHRHGLRCAGAELLVRPGPLSGGAGGERGLGAGGVGAFGTLLGPEGTGVSLPCGVVSLVSSRAVSGWSNRSSLRTFLALAGGGAGAGVRRRRRGDGVARCLRTAQWTRASLISAKVILQCGQVFKGTRWMPWHQEPKKDVGACDKPRGVGNRTLIRGFPNGETRLESCPVTRI
jgi:hypothetical protein